MQRAATIPLSPAGGTARHAPAAYPMPRPLHSPLPAEVRPKVNRLPRGWKEKTESVSAHDNLPVPVPQPQQTEPAGQWTAGFITLVVTVAVGMHVAMRFLLGGEYDSGITRTHTITAPPLFGAVAEAPPYSATAVWRLAERQPVHIAP